MRNTLKVLAWGFVGLTLTGALSYGAFAIAGNSLSKPATPLRMVVPRLVASPADARTPSPKASRNKPSPHKPSPHATRTPSPPAYQPPATSAPAPRPASSPSVHEREPHHGDD